ncbi:MAG TPA: TetR/AcrR family transcriptional regulator [Gemmatimonadota bacterium]|nr:TetR/AcrR family transcriptional regulator [Gemmatimonadota bacterium]
MPRVTQAHFDARHHEILVAAHRCFARRGFREATMQEIADEAGLSAGALYRYFDGKEALIQALAAWGQEQKGEALAELVPGGGAGALGRMVVEVLGSLEAEGSDTAIALDVRLWGEALGQTRLAKIVAGGLAALREPIAAYVRRERRAGRIRKDADPEAVARAIVALMAGIELQKAYDPGLDVAESAKVVREWLQSLAPEDR